MKARSVLVGALLGAAMLVAGVGVASANNVWCVSDPPVHVVTPGGTDVEVNNQVYLPTTAANLKHQITDDATAAPDGSGGTVITVRVHVPATAHVVSSVHRYAVTAEKDGNGLITLYLDIPTG
jgi:hypothetical protein